uniref:Uncharacterized protein n=1 Tax=Globisporangium ultimum (strain ATCC 200006 / CBS 805.95 / DAOM BR144) TaxID=431595 RepID=K3WCJ7_GLOUD
MHIRRKDQNRILEQTLQLLFACEVLIFVEYMKTFMSFLYGSCIGSLWNLPNAKYNLILMTMTMTMTRNGMLTEVATSFRFTKKRYGISVLYLLAFVLETYWMTLQGKLLGCFITILSTATILQGVDFTFEFDYGEMLQGPANAP